RLSDLVPDFLRRPVTAESLQAYFDEVNPKHLADAVNAEFETLVLKLAKFADAIATELPKVGDSLKSTAAHALDGILRDAFNAVFVPLKTQLEALDPAGIEADLDQ